MKKYILTFTCIFCISALASTIYAILSYKNSPNIYTPISNDIQKNTFTLPNTDFTSITEVETIENKLIKEPLNFLMPVDSNEIGMKFSNDQLIYSKTLDEWILHAGIDIITPIGSPVYASEKGEITEISSNIGDGIKITITHNDGYKSIYSNLSTTKMIQEGQVVDKGQVISGIGKTSTFEYEEKDHLHFEIHKDGKALNPLALLNN